ncbi:hypothetical protein ACHWQZ_G010035 [Mnemiopsis leidyi]
MGEVVDTLQQYLEEDQHSTGKSISENLNDILLKLKHYDNKSRLITTIAERSEIVKYLIEGLDTKVSLFKALCPVLYSWVQHNTDQSLALVCEFIPSLIWTYLSSVGSEEPEEAESILMNLANNLSTKPGFNFRLPSIHMISVYHHPAKMQYTGGLTEASLSKGFNMEPVYSTPARDPYTSITASNRLALLTMLLEKYNQGIGDMSHASLDRYCWLCMWVCGSGMLSSAVPTNDMKCWSFSQTRFTLNGNFMTALAAGLQYCLYNGHYVVAKSALETVAIRAQYDVCAEVMLLTASLLDTIKISSVTPASKPFGIPVPQLSGTQDDTRPVRRSIIRHEDIQQLRKRVSSNEIREDSENEGGPSPASVIVDCNESSDDSDIHIAGFRGGRLQNTPV